ncbi:MAG: N-acetylneuraminate synthase [Geobacter sp.]
MLSDKRVLVIAEAGVNHNGSLDLAKQLIEAAVDAGADAVKFQTFNASALATGDAKKADYQKVTSGANESQFEMLKRLELTTEAHHQLVGHCKKHGIHFLSTPFDLDSIDLLVSVLDVSLLKISSGDITNAPLLHKSAKTQKPIIISTGMSTLADVECALGVLAHGYVCHGQKPCEDAFRAAFASSAGQQALSEKVTLLHCTTEYPAPFDAVNLRAMETLSAAFGLRVGFSDHTAGVAVPIAAVARGAAVIEKHFTLDKNLPGPDHRASLEPAELKVMITAVRQVELALGTGRKFPAACEMANMAVARKSLVSACPIKAGELFTENNLTVKRPGTGVLPLHYWDMLGTAAKRNFAADEVIEA